ncbi:MAG: dehydrogenase E1 component [Candidatus Gottesmanbacteria bacterium GW2011_GWA1_43_11]|uniref:Dehydrogenase E1 component n=1 Tax=Candidatus Gottesmanbacteria bacterium GW2011_GWA1_43_11 TaxID=1618436 RepID=A0A0G1FEY7_9BACT|nr:MAG: dehydrogenase E1 component [Candidatus Gottesmanbacteria bacterium GW2011_GWA1_43_11]
MIKTYFLTKKTRLQIRDNVLTKALALKLLAVLTRNDPVMSNHRAHGHYLAKGGDLYRFFAEIYGKADGCAKGRGGSMHLIDQKVNFLGSTPIVGSIVPVATGVAFAEKLKQNKTVMCVFLGEAVVEEGVFHESINYAVLKQLPIIYICENNLYSVYTPLNLRQPERGITQLISGHGIPAISADGNNIRETYNVIKSAYLYVHSGKGPVFLEFFTYRQREHCGHLFDNHLGYRSEQEFLEWKKQDPVSRLKQLLIKKKYLSTAQIQTLQNKLTVDSEKILEQAHASTTPHKTINDADTYA